MSDALQTAIAEKGRAARRMLRASQGAALVALSLAGWTAWRLLSIEADWLGRPAESLILIGVTATVNMGLVAAATALVKKMTGQRVRDVVLEVRRTANRDPQVRDSGGIFFTIDEDGVKARETLAMHPETAKAIAEAIPAWVLSMSDDFIVIIEPPLASATLRAAHAVDFADWLEKRSGSQS